VKPDHYAVLGVAPTSEDVVIRAAYHALMRRYHPDANGSAEASERARAINAAYAVLSDPFQRAQYDALIAGRPSRRPMTGPILTGVIFAVALGLLPFAIMSSPSTPDESRAAAEVQERAAARREERRTAQPAAHTDPDVTPAPTALPSPVPGALPSVEAAASSVTVAARGPRVAAAPPPAAKLATAPKPRQQVAAVPPRQVASAPTQPVNLAMLDQRWALLYSQSWSRADAARRARLLETRGDFVARRDRCRSSNCVSDVYLDGMREISDIMGGRSQRR
jgi:DnaJ-like protein